ncbi:LysR family transcriptional regulator [Heliobacterium chlorum]|uniref:LysR family transcriptional regulator n=1 Tax=Heliobacterium chlorum TaxID=2698 RepID=A0ABR7T3H3_HELCL|nr:LysR family transcriptional regulator [Heliobacterium chlorum]MBC9785206.1 LysR family transcriptional regulator [Heliobacterium chlorum]
MFVNTELYRTFYLVAKEGSISRAAEQLFITQPAVSRSIQQLEERCGCVLFFRTPKGVKLTKEGELLYPYIEQAFNFISLGEKTISEVKELQKGEITFGAGDTICKHFLPPHLKNFKRAHPGIRIHVTNQNSPSIIKMIKKGELDIGFIHLPVVNDQYSLEQMAVYEVMKIQDCFVVGEKYRQLAETPRSIKEILQYPLILLEKASSSRIYFEKYLAQNNLSIKPEFELSDFELLIQFALIDFGVACVIKNFISKELRDSSLYEVTPLEPIPPRYIGVVHHKSIPLPAAAKEFLSFIVQNKNP